MFFDRYQASKKTLPAIQKHLALTSIIFYLLFTAIATYQIIFSNLKMQLIHPAQVECQPLLG